MKRGLLMGLLLVAGFCNAQTTGTRSIRIILKEEKGAAIANANVSLLTIDSVLLQTTTTDINGLAEWKNLDPGKYIVKASFLGYETAYQTIDDLGNTQVYTSNLIMKQSVAILGAVRVIAKKPLVQFLPDKTVINVDAGITNAGATVMEVLEKSPGITIDRNGNLSMKGRPAVQVMIDGKLTQLSGTDLQNLLHGMSSTQVETIELIENPGARYDAAGNAGIINIKTKKNKQKGFNGSVSTAYTQGRFPKNNNSLIINSRSGSINFFANYSGNFNKQLLDMYALRTYYNDDGTISSLLEQPYYTRTTSTFHNLKTGIDWFASSKTTLGVALTGLSLRRKSNSTSTIEWQKESGAVDSTITTTGLRDTDLDHLGLNLNGRHSFDENRELSADMDIIKYDIYNGQYFENQLLSPGSPVEASKGEIPSSLKIFSAKADYTQRMKNVVWEAGWKSARIATDNLAEYYIQQNNNWEPDLGKSNHFLYTENIHAAYSSIDVKTGKWHWQTGLRYENTGYKARQLGNAVIKDSSFNRNYSSLFPTAFVTYDIDSSNSITFRTGRRIDRPAFHKLNPFIFILNKYTLQKGNPFFKPQYTWNFEINHVYKQALSTSISYNLTNDYFSQVFLADTLKGTIIYTDGNVGKLQNFGVSMSLQLSPKPWWSFTTVGVYNHKIIEGVLWEPYKTKIHQFTLNINNQFRFKKGWGAELSGYYISRNQNDLQEVLDPTGQVGIGLSKQVLKNKGTLKLNFRDIFYSQDMEGFSVFENSNEYFRLQWDSQVAAISFVYRFGKAMKQPKRSGGGASDEINRVGTGN